MCVNRVFDGVPSIKGTIFIYLPNAKQDWVNTVVTALAEINKSFSCSYSSLTVHHTWSVLTIVKSL
jgi:hypothetical protein